MTFTSFDPRKSIRSKIGDATWDEDKGEGYAITVTDSDGETAYIPMYLAEEVRSEVLAEMPFLDMNLAYCTYEPHDIGASTRKHDAYIDIGLWFTNTDNIDATSFGKKICDDIINLIRTNQCSFDGITFINVEGVRHIREDKAHQVVFHYVITVYCLWYDICT